MKSFVKYKFPIVSCNADNIDCGVAVSVVCVVDGVDVEDG
jgi:hypothetical protein